MRQAAVVLSLILVWGCAKSSSSDAPPTASTERTKTESEACMSNLKQLTTAVIIYMSENDDAFPPGPKWNDGLMKYLQNDTRLTCPTVKREGKEGGYALNAGVAGRQGDAIKDSGHTPLLFETAQLGLGVVHGPEAMLEHARHEQHINMTFVDGHGEAR